MYESPIGMQFSRPSLCPLHTRVDLIDNHSHTEDTYGLYRLLNGEWIFLTNDCEFLEVPI